MSNLGPNLSFATNHVTEMSYRRHWLHTMMIKDMETLGAVLVIEERKRSYHIRVIILKLTSETGSFQFG